MLISTRPSTIVRWNILLFLPLLIVLHLTGVETLQWPQNNEIVLMLLVNAAITLYVAEQHLARPGHQTQSTRMKLMYCVGQIVGNHSVSDMLMMTSMLMTSPLAVTLGLSLTIPLAVVGDLFRGTPVGGVVFFVGAGLVLAGFIAVGWADARQREEEEEIAASLIDPMERRDSLASVSAAAGSSQA